ncbi:hypothetical protein A176_006352 [Myxococcus hansupus]|uniref:WGR domain-containing protein n=1 Tax=Pseudomyxococcus hansupus TaxID=1297742 RepID=A0A0H4X767_9BACT|nr:WGR domain-containing protein [Myxococcus hansupus]AKQ69440.1 hypothetical protein A176_006352 [Myxococcus hansupus]
MSKPSLPAPVPRASLTLIAREKGTERSWSFERGGAAVTLREGALGGKSKQTEKTFDSEAEALAFCEKSLRAKVEKGSFAVELGLRAVPLAALQAELKVAGSAEPTARVLVHDGDLVIPHDLILDDGFGLLAPEKDAPSPLVGLLVRARHRAPLGLLRREDAAV